MRVLNRLSSILYTDAIYIYIYIMYLYFFHVIIRVKYVKSEIVLLRNLSDALIFLNSAF